MGDIEGARIEAGLLGPVRLALGSNAIRVSGERQRACLALLLLARGRPVSTDALRDELWGEGQPVHADASLQMQISRLRRLLEQAGVDPAALRADAGAYSLRLDEPHLDVARFEELAAEGRRLIEEGRLEDGVDRLRGALDLWRGGALADAGDGSRVSAERARLEAERAAVTLELAETELQLGRHLALTPALERLAEEHPFEERPLALLMLALYRAGRQADALTAFRVARQRLIDVLGLEPTPALRELNDAILRHDPSLAATPSYRPRTSTQALEPQGRRGWRAIALTALAVAAIAAAAGAAVEVVTGRSGAAAIGPDRVAVIDSGSGTVASVISGVQDPAVIAADGRFAWVADTTSSTVIRVDPRASRVLLSLATAPPTALAAGQGGIWVLSQADREVQEVNAAAGRVVRTVAVGNGPVALAAGAGAVWVADSLDGTVMRIDPLTGRVLAQIAVGGSPEALAVGSGAVWVADPTSGLVDRIDPASNRVTAAIPSGDRPTALAVAAGDVWVADALDGTVSRLDPSTGAALTTLSIGDGGNVLTAAGQWLWVDGPQPGELTRIDAARAVISLKLRLGSPVSALTSAGDRVLAATTVTAAARRGGTLQVVGARGADPLELADPNFTFDQDAWQLQAMTNDGLLAARKVDGAVGAELVPDLAATMPVASDGARTWTFRLRSGLRYSTGRPVRASDVRASFERLYRLVPLSSETPALGPLGLIGEDACQARPAACNLSRGILVDDRDGVIVLRLHQPQPDLLHRLATPAYSILPAGTPPRPLTRPPFPATGPYEVIRQTRSEIDLARNPYFRVWSRPAQPPGFPDRITWRLNVSASQGLKDVLTGRADVLDSGAAPSDADLLASRYPTLLHPDPFPDTEAIFLNTKRPPFSSPRVREAVALGVDRRRLAADEGSPETWPVTCQILPPGIPGYRPFCPYTAGAGPAGAWSGTDLATARALIAQAGVAGTSVVVAGPSDRLAITRVIRDFAAALRALGLRPRVVLRPIGQGNLPGGYFQFIGEPQVQAGWYHWFIDRPDPNEFFTGVFDCQSVGQQSPTAANIAKYCNPSTDAAIAAARQAAPNNPAAAAGAWAKVDRNVTRAAAWIPFANARSLDVTSTRIHGYAYNPIYSILLDQISVR